MLANIQATIIHFSENFFFKIVLDKKFWNICQTCKQKLSPESYEVLAEKVYVMKKETFLGIKICNSVLVDLQFGQFQKHKNIKRI